MSERHTKNKSRKNCGSCSLYISIAVKRYDKTYALAGGGMRISLLCLLFSPDKAVQYVMRKLRQCQQRDQDRQKL